jgi:hypothetical protein
VKFLSSCATSSFSRRAEVGGASVKNVGWFSEEKKIVENVGDVRFEIQLKFEGDG